jgi:outer membrane lipoprotein carrier protein
MRPYTPTWMGVATALMALTALATAATGVEQSPAELAQALQRKYESIKDFSADFVHVYQGGVLKKQITERGHLLVKKPGKMRWEYTAPEEKLFVSDGVKIYSYIPLDKQVLVSSVPRDDQATTPALFLAGKGNIARDYTPSFGPLPAGAPAGSRALKLIPKSRLTDYEWLLVVVDPMLAIRILATADAQGGQSTFSFVNMKENVGTPDKAFTFTIPRGVDVVAEGSR